MKNTAAVLDEFGVKYDKAVISAHRMPEEMMAFAKDAVDNGIEVIIAGLVVRPICREWLLLILFYQSLVFQFSHEP